MDLVDLIAEKRFLGQEFLTWLWYKSDERGGSIYLPEAGGDIQLYFEKHLLLEHGEGDQLEKVICQGLQSELREARTGLAMGKKIEQARIVLRRDDYEWNFTLRGSLLEYRNVRLPKTMNQAEEEDDAAAREGMLLDRIGLFAMLTQTMDQLFRLFLTIRTGPDWPKERAQISQWINAAVPQVAPAT